MGKESVDCSDPAVVASLEEKIRFSAHAEPALRYVQGRGSLILLSVVHRLVLVFPVIFDFLVSDSGEVVRIRSRSLLTESPASSLVAEVRRSN